MRNFSYLIKTDYNGDTLWTKTYGGVNSDRGYSVKQTIDSGYIITGSTTSFGSGGKDLYLIKTDNNGNTLWTKTHGRSVVDVGYSVQQTFDNGYIVVGETKYTSNGEYNDVYLVKTNNEGDTLWTKTFGGNSIETGMSVQQTNDSGYIITGGTFSMGSGLSDVYLIKTNNIGDTIWTKTYGSNSREYGRSVQQTTDGGYIVCGISLSSDNVTTDVYLIKTNSIGETLWTNTFGGIGIDYGFSVQQTDDGGYIVTGSTTTFGAGGVDLYLIKTDEYGQVVLAFEVPVLNSKKKLIKTIDLLGREIQPKKNIPYIEIYDDGSTEKKLIVK